jgi:hypothetical protein
MNNGNIMLLILFAGYMLPWFVALGRSHPNVAPIFIVNLFFGWTFIGWVVALAWSASAVSKPQPARSAFLPEEEQEASWRKPTKLGN